MISTRGGNQSWSGLVKYFDGRRCDYLFALVADGRQTVHFLTRALDCKSTLTSVARDSESRSSPADPWRRLVNRRCPTGERRSGRAGLDCGSSAKMLNGFEFFLPHLQDRPQDRPSRPCFKPSKYERKLGRMCQATINQKRRVNIPYQLFLYVSFELGVEVRVTSEGDGRVVLERIESPSWA